MLVALFDAQSERRRRASASPTVADILAVHQGTILAWDPKAFRNWRREVAEPEDRERGLSGADLEQAVFGIAALDPFAHDPRSQIVKVVA